MVGCIEERTCQWCTWHNWDYDRCSLSGDVITGNGDRVCPKHETEEEQYERFFGNDKKEKTAEAD